MEEISAEVKSKMKQWYNYCLYDIGSKKKPIVMDTCKDVITEFYSFLSFPQPIFIHVDNPFEAALLAHVYENKIHVDGLEQVERSELLIPTEVIENARRATKGAQIKNVYSCNLGNLNIFWLASLLFAKNELGFKFDYKQYPSYILDNWLKLVKDCGLFTIFENVCFLSNRPTIHRNKRGQISSLDGPAIHYDRGVDFYDINGISIDGKFLTPEVTSNDIDNSHYPNEIKSVLHVHQLKFI